MGNGGAPTKYKKAYNEQVKKLCMLGADDKILADFFGVVEKTINNWKKAEPEFLQSLKEGKVIADMEVANSLYKRSVGFTTEEKTESTSADGDKNYKIVTKEVPPDTGAAFIWLKNRRPDKWRDKQEIQHSGDMGVTIFDDIK